MGIFLFTFYTGSEQTLAASSEGLGPAFRSLDFLSIQERLKKGLEGLSAEDRLIVAQLLLSAASDSNANTAFELLESLKPAEIACLPYARAELALRKGRPELAEKELSSDLKAARCPPSRLRNARGLLKLAQVNRRLPPPAEIEMSLKLFPQAQAKHLPIVTWKNMAFLVDTGAEQTIWNPRCSQKLGLKIDRHADYGGADSLGKTVVGHYAEPTVSVLGLPRESLRGFTLDLTQAAKSYAAFGLKAQLCGILSPQRIIPKGLMVLDWDGGQILFCQSERCRKSLDIPVDCPMYQFQGRPYFLTSVEVPGSAKSVMSRPKLFLVDTGANLSSVNLGFFDAPPITEKVQSAVSGVSGTQAKSKVMPQAELRFCNIGFRLKPFPVRESRPGPEWNENGKIGMNVLGTSLVAVDFGKGMALVH